MNVTQVTTEATRDGWVPVDLLAHLRRARDHIDGHYRSPLGLDATDRSR
jgi:hypothetical protein